MYLRRKCKTVRGVQYEYWALVESARTARGPRQRVVASIGKMPGLDREDRLGWEDLEQVLSGRPAAGPSLFEPEPPEWARVDLKRVQAERLRRFGDVFLALAVWRRLRLDEILRSLPLEGREEIGWDLMACIQAVARFCEPSSDLAVAEGGYGRTALDDLLGVPVEKVNDDRLYRALDRILPHKDTICKALQQRYAEWFGTAFDFLFYDVTSIYFEGQMEANPQAQFGYSRDHRPDCRQICVGLVVTREGLPVGYEVFSGDRADVTTLEEMLALMEDKYGKAGRVWVFDRGIVSEENLTELRERGARYLVGTPKPMLRRFERELTEQEQWTRVRDGLEVRLVSHPDGGTDRFVLCRSRDRAEKERAMLRKAADRLEAKLCALRETVRRGRLVRPEAIMERVGRWRGRHTRAEHLFEVQLVSENGEARDLLITRRREREAWAELAHGCYLLRTNLTEETPETLWRAYIQLTQAEEAFRVTKNDLGVRPVFHQTRDRVQGHVLICFLALAMRRSLELWMQACGLGTCCRQLLTDFREIRSLDLVLPVEGQPSPVRLRVVGRPEERVLMLLHRLGLRLPSRGRIINRIVDVVPNPPPPTPAICAQTAPVLTS